MKHIHYIILIFQLININLGAESLNVLIVGETEISLDRIEGVSIPLSCLDSALIRIKGDPRFFRGIQFDLTAPANFMAYRGHLASVFYNNLSGNLQAGTANIYGNLLCFEPLPEKIMNTWQIPVRSAHGLRSSPYVTIPTDIVSPNSFPLLFRLMPVIKGITEELEKMVFILHVKPILSDEGAVKINLKYPDQLPGKPVIILINDKVIENINEEVLLREGEHHLLVLSEDYRNQSSRFTVERAKVMELLVELEDPTPLLLFESPEGTRIFVNNIPVYNINAPFAIEPGSHEIRFQMSNYSIIRPITVQKGKTYKVAMSIDVNITETF